MKVAFDVSSAIYGTGVSDYTLNLIAHLPQDILVPFGFSLRRRDDLLRLVPKGMALPFPPALMHYLWNVLHWVNVERFVGKVDIYHSSDWTQGPSRAAKVTTIHDLSPFLFPEELDPQIVAVHQKRMRWAVKECSKFICVSQNTAADLKRLFAVPESKISVIAEALPARFDLSPQITKYTNFLLAIGTRQPRKNITRLINAYLKYKDKYNLPPKLIIIGEPPSTLPLLNSPALIYTGYLPDQDLVNYLAGAEAFVYPSLYEGFGLPILNAFYHQTPVVCSNTSSMPEVAGDAAILVDPYNEEAIAAGIARAIADREKLIAAGTKQLSKFSWETAAQQTLTVYQSLK